MKGWRTKGYARRSWCRHNINGQAVFYGEGWPIRRGTAIGGSVLGCAEFEISIPCLGPASAPTPVSGMTYIRASQIGCALDCNLRDGSNKHTGGEATDDGPRISAAMAGASATNPITLIIDGSALISGLSSPQLVSGASLGWAAARGSL